MRTWLAGVVAACFCIGGPSASAEDSIIRVSVDSAGVQGNDGSFNSAISADGRYVAFRSGASNLVAGDSNNLIDIFLRDTVSGTTTRVSVDSAEVQANDGHSGHPAISADGRYVAFDSGASNLVPGDNNNTYDIFLRDTLLGTTTRVSMDSGVVEGNGSSLRPTISADGRYVAFDSDANNLVPGDSNISPDVFLRDTLLRTTTQVSVDTAGVQGGYTSHSPAISADGRHVAFQSEANNLVAGDSNGRADIFLRGTVTRTTTRVSEDSAGVQGDGTSSAPTISADGRYVAFHSYANNLVPGDSNNDLEVFLRDTVTGTTTRVSVDSAGVQGDFNSEFPAISADGRYVAFQSASSNLVPGGTNVSGPLQIFLRDTVNGTTTKVSVDSAGVQGNGFCQYVAISADARYVTFACDSANLVPGDSNNAHDVFRVRTAPQPDAQVPTTPTGLSPGTLLPPGPVLLPSSLLLSWNLVPGATYYDLVIRDVASGFMFVITRSAFSTFSPSLPPGRVYKWAVAACNAVGCSPFAQAGFFQTHVGIGPDPPGGLSPGNGSWPVSVYGTQVALTWSPVLGAGAYSVKLYDRTLGLSLAIPLVVGATSKTITMFTGHQYDWSVASCFADSVDDDVNCPNRADEIRFVQGNGSAWIDGKKPGISGFIAEASAYVDSLILVTHGWNSDAAGWADPLVDRICAILADKYNSPPNTTDRVNGGRECVIDRWRVMSYDWAAASCNKPDSDLPGCLPDTAVINAAERGARLGDQARSGVRYKFIHLIAHSAGSRLVQAFANRYNCWGDGTPCGPVPQAAVHMTLFDAFCPSVLVCSYGSGALWAEQYVDHRPLGISFFGYGEEDTSTGAPPAPLNYRTNVTLANARTFDVTDLDNIQDYTGFYANAAGYHAFPFRQYLDSAGVAPFFVGEFNASRISNLDPKLGAYLAAWDHDDAAKPSFSPAAHIQSMANTFGRTGRLNLHKDSWRASTTANDTAGTTDSTFFNTGFTYTPLDNNCTANSTPSTIGVGTCVPAALSSRLTPLSATPDPGMMLVSATLDNVADRLSFDFTFTSAASVGWLEVLVDNSLVFIAAADGDAGSVQHAGPIEIARLEPGDHELRVVVKSDTAENASVVLSNIVFDRVVSNVPDAPLMTAATAGNHQATVVFSEAVYNGGAPVTGFTVISNPAGGVDSQAGTLGEGHVITGLNNGAEYTFTVTATNAAGISAASAPSNPVTPFAASGLSVTDVSLAEGNSGTQLATFTVNLSQALANPVSFDIATSNGTAASGTDFVANSQVGLAIAAGQTSANFAVTINGDTAVEGNETFTVNLNNAVGADVVDGQGLGTIVNDDNAALSIADVALAEGNSGTSTASFALTLSRPMPTAVTFDIATSDGSAAAGSDYVARNQAARVIDAGRTRAVFEVAVNGDLGAEGNETFNVSVSNVVGAALADGTAVGTIQNDDAAAAPNAEDSPAADAVATSLSIAQVQGSGVVSPWQGKSVSTEGIVTALVGGGLFMQTADAHRDGDPATAEGIFVATPDRFSKVGDTVRVHGLVQEVQVGDDPNQLTLTQILATEVSLLSRGNPLPRAVQLDASNAGADQGITGLERYEGMRVSVPGLSVVSPVGGRIDETTGQVHGSAKFYGVAKGVARPFREPGISALERPRGKRGVSPSVFDSNPERLLVDSLGQLGAHALLVDAGDTVTGLVGVLGYGDGAYQVLPDPSASVLILPGAFAKPASVPTSAQATIGSFNLRRFFDDRRSSNEPVLSPGAYAQRVAKTANAICAYARTPDILSVTEVEGLAALSDLAAAVNRNDGNVLFPASCKGDAGYRAYLLPGNDAQQRNLGFLVSTAPVRPGVPRVEVLSVSQASASRSFRLPDGSSARLNERPPLILKARINEANGRSVDVTVIANHLSALDGNLAAPGEHGWVTRGDSLRARRAAQALSLAQLVQARQRANPQERLVVLGDFGASEFNQGYDDLMGVLTGREAPNAKVLRHIGSPISPPLTNLTTLIPQPERYTDIREGNAEAISHVLVNQALLADFAALHLETVRINADFAVEDFGESALPMRAGDSDPQVLYLERR